LFALVLLVYTLPEEWPFTSFYFFPTHAFLIKLAFSPFPLFLSFFPYVNYFSTMHQFIFFFFSNPVIR